MVAKGKRGFSAGHDRLAGLFEPDVLLPAQFFAAFRREGGLERERLLMLAVLEDAIDCYQKYAHSRDPRGRQMFDEAREDRKSTRLNSSHSQISYAVFCLKKKKNFDTTA